MLTYLPGTRKSGCAQGCRLLACLLTYQALENLAARRGVALRLKTESRAQELRVNFIIGQVHRNFATTTTTAAAAGLGRRVQQVVASCRSATLRVQLQPQGGAIWTCKQMRSFRKHVRCTCMSMSCPCTITCMCMRARRGSCRRYIYVRSESFRKLP